MLRLRSFEAAALLALCVGVVSQVQAQEPQGRLKKLRLGFGISIAYPANWQVLPREFANATVLAAKEASTGVAPRVARTVLTAEPHKDHAAALRQLADIAAEVSATPEYRVIGGWPALERRYMSPLDRTGQRGRAPDGGLALRITTAMAAGAVLVRIETTLLGDTPSPSFGELQPRIVAQAIAIGRSVDAPERGDPAAAGNQIELLRAMRRSISLPSEALRKRMPDVPDKLAGAEAPPAVATGLPFGELEIAASSDGQHIVIAANSGYAVSHDFGKKFAKRSIPLPSSFKPRGDPTIAVGNRNAFYIGYVAQPEPTAASRGGCSISIVKSTANGEDFKFLSHAAFCPKRVPPGSSLCFPDQGHMAADRTKTRSDQPDQLYLVYRHCTGQQHPGDPALDTCDQATKWCRGRPSIVCSMDAGKTWGTPRDIKKGRSVQAKPLLVEGSGDADFPRVAVARNGDVYVVFRNGNLLQFARYSSCASGLQKIGGTILITEVMNGCSSKQLIDKCHCPIAGLDRCNFGNLLSSPTIAVDDSDPSRIYVAYARHSSVGENDKPANDDIVVQVSTDSGATWGEGVKINNDAVPARRFMPWMCAMNGQAYVTWYDRRAINPADNDLTDYYLGSAGIQSGVLKAGSEVNLSDSPDRQCGHWPKPPRTKDDAGRCSRQPQMAGVCGPNDRRTRCDLECGTTERPCTASCPRKGDTCTLGGGHPNYGDYNGNACAAGTIFTAWASATAPRRLSSPPPPSEMQGIRILYKRCPRTLHPHQPPVPAVTERAQPSRME